MQPRTRAARQPLSHVALHPGAGGGCQGVHQVGGPAAGAARAGGHVRRQAGEHHRRHVLRLQQGGGGSGGARWWRCPTAEAACASESGWQQASTGRHLDSHSMPARAVRQCLVSPAAGSLLHPPLRCKAPLGAPPVLPAHPPAPARRRRPAGPTATRSHAPRGAAAPAGMGRQGRGQVWVRPRWVRGQEQ